MAHLPAQTDPVTTLGLTPEFLQSLESIYPSSLAHTPLTAEAISAALSNPSYFDAQYQARQQELQRQQMLIQQQQAQAHAEYLQARAVDALLQSAAAAFASSHQQPHLASLNLYPYYTQQLIAPQSQRAAAAAGSPPVVAAFPVDHSSPLSSVESEGAAARSTPASSRSGSTTSGSPLLTDVDLSPETYDFDGSKAMPLNFANAYNLVPIYQPAPGTLNLDSFNPVFAHNSNGFNTVTFESDSSVGSPYDNASTPAYTIGKQLKQIQHQPMVVGFDVNPQDAYRRAQNATDPKKRHVCPTCQRGFARAFNLKSHIMTHDPSRPKPHICPHASCGRGFSRAHDLERHRMGIHSEGPLLKQPTSSGEKAKGRSVRGVGGSTSNVESPSTTGGTPSDSGDYDSDSNVGRFTNVIVN